MEDVGADVGLVVVFLGEEEHLRLPTRLLLDVTISRVDEPEFVGGELKGLGIEGNVELPGELFIYLAETGGVVGEEGFLELLAAPIHHSPHLPKAHPLHHCIFEPARQGGDQDHIDVLEGVVIQVYLHLFEDVDTLWLHLANHPTQSLPEITLKVKPLHYLLYAIIYFLWECFLGEIGNGGGERAIVVPICILPEGPISQVMITSADDYSQEGGKLDQPQLGVEDAVPHVGLGGRDQREVVVTSVLSSEKTVFLVALSVHNDEGHIAAQDRFEDFGLVAVSGDEECLHALADGVEGEGGNILVE